MKTETTHKQSAIKALAKIRSWRKDLIRPDMVTGFDLCAVELLRYIETAHPATAGNSELWTNGCTEAELGPESTIGDHLAVTRKALGLLP